MNAHLKIPSPREVYFLINTNPEFVEGTLLALYKRHKANDGAARDGKGFNLATKKDGVRLGRWLDKHGKFTSGVNATTGEYNRSTKSREDHLVEARAVLMAHIPQIIAMITESIEKIKADAERKRREAEERKAMEGLTREYGLVRCGEILSLLNGKAVAPDELPTQRDVNPLPFRRRTA